MKVENFKQLEQSALNQKSFVEVTEDLYYYALENMPPIYLKNGTFQMGECYFGDFFYTFGKKDGKYFGCLCNKRFSLENF